MLAQPSSNLNKKDPQKNAVFSFFLFLPTKNS